MPLPNFFLFDAPKAGTTTLYHCLKQYPEIYMSLVKEPSALPDSFRLNPIGRKKVGAKAITTRMSDLPSKNRLQI